MRISSAFCENKKQQYQLNAHANVLPKEITFEGNEQNKRVSITKIKSDNYWIDSDPYDIIEII
jgi:hypothetical protein